jgi:adenosylcobinamide amidohydrolase
MNLDFPGLTAQRSPDVIILHSERPLHCLSSAIVGGGAVDTRTILSRHVDKSYDCTGRGPVLPYAGPATPVGWLIGRCVRQALKEALDAYRP